MSGGMGTGGEGDVSLAEVLSRCLDPRSAADALVGHLVDIGYEMPSVYFA